MNTISKVFEENFKSFSMDGKEEDFDELGEIKSFDKKAFEKHICKKKRYVKSDHKPQWHPKTLQEKLSKKTIKQPEGKKMRTIIKHSNCDTLNMSYYKKLSTFPKSK